MSDAIESRLAESAAIAGTPPAESPYYDDAERWTFLFWDEGTVFHSLFEQLDLSSVVELSCGHGRHSERVAKMTSQLTLLDMHEANLEFCRSRLRDHPAVRYCQGNGYSLDPIEAASTMAIFCYDSMVHFGPYVVQNYLRETARILKPGGMGLFHHSNYPALMNRHHGLNPHARNHMTKRLFAAYAQEAGLVVQESLVIPWGGVENLDCVTLVQRPA